MRVAALALLSALALAGCASELPNPQSACVVARNGDCSGGSLQRASVVGRDVPGMVFARADLRGATLMSNNFEGANFVGADFAGATLSGARLVNADLSSADFTRANLMGADLTNANISGADFDRAQLGGTIFPDGRVCAAGSIGRCVTEWEAPSLFDQFFGIPGW
ncbi:MAG: pentapeptide repeat protein [Rhodospirillales bacterium]|jgi:uncharacterized protein YjbI with pentapeptide repeats|nr:pentapeptide repeat protein [Rhodospirillales bacterium]